MRVALDEAEVQRALRDAVLDRLGIADEERGHNRGEARLELTDQLRQHVLAYRHARAYEQRPRRLATHLLQACVELGRQRQDALGVLERELASRCERDPPLRAVEEARVQLLLELLHLERDRRLAHEPPPPALPP